MDMMTIILISVGAIFVLSTLIMIMKRYRIADSNQILVVTGKVGGDKSAKTIHGGATFIWPLIQQYDYLDLSPIQIDIDLKNALSAQNIRIDVPSSFTIAIGTEPELMAAAAERLLGKSIGEISSMARDIIFGQLRSTIADMTIEEINKNRDKFIENILKNVESELNKLGLVVLNVNITDITDESGYLEALGQKAAAEAIQQARIDVAEKERDGAIGAAEAKREERIKTAEANATAVTGENLSKVKIAESDAELKVKQEEAKKLELAAALTNKAEAEKEGYDANKIAEEAKTKMEEARLENQVLVPARAEKDKLIIEAEAAKKEEVLAGEAEGEAAKAKMEGEAKGLQAVLEAKAAGFEKIVKAAGGAEQAAQLLIIEQLPELARIQVEAIKNVKIDKITVWDSGSGQNGEGGSTSNFLQSMLKFVPPMNELLEQSGLSAPDWMAKTLNTNDLPKETVIQTAVNKDDAVEETVEPFEEKEEKEEK